MNSDTNSWRQNPRSKTGIYGEGILGTAAGLGMTGFLNKKNIAALSQVSKDTNHVRRNTAHTPFIRSNENFDELQTYPIIEYVKNGSVEQIRDFLKETNQDDVNVKDGLGKSPLYYAVTERTEFPEITRLLIEAGADVNSKDARYNTPLYYIAGNYETDRMNFALSIINMLLDAGADVNVKNKNGHTALHNVKLAPIADRLIKAGADVNAIDKSPHNTPLHHQKKPDVIQLLIEAGADVNAQSRTNNTPLHFAYKLDQIKALIDGGADITIRNNNNETPIDTIIKKILYDNGLYYKTIEERIEILNYLQTVSPTISITNNNIRERNNYRKSIDNNSNQEGGYRRRLTRKQKKQKKQPRKHKKSTRRYRA